MIASTVARSFAPVVLGVALLSPAASAQETQAPTDPAPPATPTPPIPAPPVMLTTPAAPPWDATADSLLVFVELRSPGRIDDETAVLRAEHDELETRLRNQKSLLERSDAYRKLKEAELESIKTRRELAGKEKREAEKAQLDEQKKVGDAQLAILKKLRDLREREIATTKASLELNEARRKALEKEGELAVRRTERDEMKIRKLEGQVLEAQIEVARRQRDFANRQAQILEARKKIFDSESRLLKERAG